jgi:hypothetical protein
MSEVTTGEERRAEDSRERERRALQWRRQERPAEGLRECRGESKGEQMRQVTTGEQSTAGRDRRGEEKTGQQRITEERKGGRETSTSV